MLTWVGRVAAGDYPTWSWAWVPALNVGLDLRVDGLGLVMALLVLGIGGLILIYASGYMAGDPYIGRFFAILSLFMAAMLGVVLADNIILLFIFWELTSITSYMLIGFKHESEKSQKSALQALVVTGTGGLVLLAGLIMLGLIGGSWELSTLLKQGDLFRQDPGYTAVLILILIGAFTKSAQFPFHFWLPNAMAAPTPVSAYLHSATMVKAGIYLLARLNPILGGTALWFYTLVIVGGFTGLLGAWLAWQQTDLKRIMAYTTISALGTLVFLLGLGAMSAVAYKTAVLFLIVHSFYKGALFMVAGAVDHETGTREVTELGGLARAMPFTLVGVLLATVSMAGFPPLLGFVGKELIYEAALESSRWVVGLATAALLTNALMVTAAGIVLIPPFLRGPRPTKVHEAPWTMWLGPLVLGMLALLVGLFVGSSFFAEQIIQPAAKAVAGDTAYKVKLYLWPTSAALWKDGAFSPFGLSLLTWLLGAAAYVVHGRLRPWATRTDATMAPFGPENGYFKGFDALLSTAAWLTNRVQTGHLRYYLTYAFVVLSLLVGGALLAGFRWVLPVWDVRLHEVGIALLIVMAIWMLIRAQSRLAAVAALGVVGYGVALLYMLFGAPDLAMTQFAIETLSVVLFVLVLYKLPRFETISTRGARLRDAILAGFMGLLVMLLVLAVTAVPGARPLTQFFAENSYLLANGRNVVNVILVDFRGLDTMVEIAVLATAAVGVFALVQAGRDNKKK